MSRAQRIVFGTFALLVAGLLGCGGASTPAASSTTPNSQQALPPAAEAPAGRADSAAADSASAPRDWTLAELKTLSRADMEREWGTHGVRAIPSGCSQDAVEITYDAAGTPRDTTKPTWTGKCIDAKTRIPANILSGVRKDATDKPAAIKPSFFDGHDALVFEYPGDWSLHLRELGPGLYLGRQAHGAEATGVVYLVGRFSGE